jgi:hypothetical protein
MSQSKYNSFTGEGCGIIGVIQIIFIVLKLCAPESTIYKLSWIEVLIPLWISLGFCGCFCIAAFIAAIYILCINVFNMYNDEQEHLENRTTIVTMNTTNETPVPIDELDLSSGV